MVTSHAIEEGTRPVRVAGFWARSLAAALDLLVLSPVLFACGMTLRLALPLPADAESEMTAWLLEMLIERNPLVLAAGAFFFAVALAYVGMFTLLGGQTIGQRCCGLRIIDDQGDAPSLVAACMRTAALPVGLFFVGLGVLWIAFDREARGFHDHVAGTYVIRVAQSPAAARTASAGPPEVHR